MIPIDGAILIVVGVAAWTTWITMCIRDRWHEANDEIDRVLEDEQ